MAAKTQRAPTWHSKTNLSFQHQALGPQRSPTARIVVMAAAGVAPQLVDLVNLRSEQQPTVEVRSACSSDMGRKLFVDGERLHGSISFVQMVGSVRWSGGL